MEDDDALSMLSFRAAATSTFAVRVSHVDTYQSLDSQHGSHGVSTSTELPVIRIYGATPAGQKCCVHVHGFFPRFFVLLPEAMAARALTSAEATDIRKRAYTDLARAFPSHSVSSSSTSASIVRAVTICRGIPFYGFHYGGIDGDETIGLPDRGTGHVFLHITLSNPSFLTRAAEAVRKGVLFGQPMQPYEAHVPYLLQFFIEANLAGMSLLHASRVRFRMPLPSTAPRPPLEDATLRWRLNLDPSLFRRTPQPPIGSTCIDKSVPAQPWAVLTRLWLQSTTPAELCHPAPSQLPGYFQSVGSSAAAPGRETTIGESVVEAYGSVSGARDVAQHAQSDDDVSGSSAMHIVEQRVRQPSFSVAFEAWGTSLIEQQRATGADDSGAIEQQSRMTTAEKRRQAALAALEGVNFDDFDDYMNEVSRGSTAAATVARDVRPLPRRDDIDGPPAAPLVPAITPPHSPTVALAYDAEGHTNSYANSAAVAAAATVHAAMPASAAQVASEIPAWLSYDLYGILHPSKRPPVGSGHLPVFRTSTCELECDIQFCDIMNPAERNPGPRRGDGGRPPMGSQDKEFRWVPSLAAIWEEERLRRHAAALGSQLLSGHALGGKGVDEQTARSILQSMSVDHEDNDDGDEDGLRLVARPSKLVKTPAQAAVSAIRVPDVSWGSVPSSVAALPRDAALEAPCAGDMMDRHFESALASLADADAVAVAAADGEAVSAADGSITLREYRVAYAAAIAKLPLAHSRVLDADDEDTTTVQAEVDRAHNALQSAADASHRQPDEDVAVSATSDSTAVDLLLEIANIPVIGSTPASQAAPTHAVTTHIARNVQLEVQDVLIQPDVRRSDALWMDGIVESEFPSNAGVVPCEGSVGGSSDEDEGGDEAEAEWRLISETQADTLVVTAQDDEKDNDAGTVAVDGASPLPLTPRECGSARGRSSDNDNGADRSHRQQHHVDEPCVRFSTPEGIAEQPLLATPRRGSKRARVTHDSTPRNGDSIAAVITLPVVMDRNLPTLNDQDNAAVSATSQSAQPSAAPPVLDHDVSEVVKCPTNATSAQRVDSQVLLMSASLCDACRTESFADTTQFVVDVDDCSVAERRRLYRPYPWNPPKPATSMQSLHDDYGESYVVNPRPHYAFDTDVPAVVRSGAPVSRGVRFLRDFEPSLRRISQRPWNAVAAIPALPQVFVALPNSGLRKSPAADSGDTNEDDESCDAGISGDDDNDLRRTAVAQVDSTPNDMNVEIAIRWRRLRDFASMARHGTGATASDDGVVEIFSGTQTPSAPRRAFVPEIEPSSEVPLRRFLIHQPTWDQLSAAQRLHCIASGHMERLRTASRDVYLSCGRLLVRWVGRQPPTHKEVMSWLKRHGGSVARGHNVADALASEAALTVAAESVVCLPTRSLSGHLASLAQDGIRTIGTTGECADGGNVDGLPMLHSTQNVGCTVVEPSGNSATLSVPLPGNKSQVSPVGIRASRVTGVRLKLEPKPARRRNEALSRRQGGKINEEVLCAAAVENSRIVATQVHDGTTDVHDAAVDNENFASLNIPDHLHQSHGNCDDVRESVQPSDTGSAALATAVSLAQLIASADHVPGLTMLSVEVHANSRGELLSDPQHDALTCIVYVVADDTVIAAKRRAASASIGHDTFDFAGALVTGVILVSPRDDGRNIATEAPKLDESGVERIRLGLGCSRRILITRVDDEVALLWAFVRLVRAWDVDMIVGWEVQRESLGFLLQRAAVRGMPLDVMLSRTPAASAKADARRGFKSSNQLEIGGRIVLDAWRLVRRDQDLKLPSYGLHAVAHAVLATRVPFFSQATLSAWWTGGNGYGPILRHRVIDHLAQRARTTLHILDALDVVGRTSEAARLLGTDFVSALTRGSQYRVECIMLRVCRSLGFVAPTPGSDARDTVNAPLQHVPLILEPASQLCADPVIVLDFVSLYPSLMIAYNLCFSTVLGQLSLPGVPIGGGSHASPLLCSKLGVMGSFRPPIGAISAHYAGPWEGSAVRAFEAPPSQVAPQRPSCPSSPYVSPSGAVFVPPKQRRGVLPRMLAEILETRAMIKRAAKRADVIGDPVLRRVMHARQFELKMIANVTYGYTSASFTGHMPCAELADAIVSSGSRTLSRAISLVRSHPDWAADVLYGDTDSLFVRLRGRTPAQAWAIGEAIAAEVTARNPPPVTLRMEKLYTSCALVTKKRYAGYMLDEQPRPPPAPLPPRTLDVKGLEMVRRDSCGLVQNSMEAALRTLFGEGGNSPLDLSAVKAGLLATLAKLYEGRLPLSAFIFAKEVKGAYKKGLPPAAIVGARAAAHDPRAAPLKGDRVRYVVYSSHKRAKLTELVGDPIALIKPSGGVPPFINVEYYAKKQLLPALHRIISLGGGDVHEWAAQVAHVVAWRRRAWLVPQELVDLTSSQADGGPLAARSMPPVQARRGAAAQQRQRALEDFGIFSQLCELCGAGTAPRGGVLCDPCASDTQRAYFVLVSRVTRAEAESRNVAAICGGCARLTDAAVCEAVDCPVYYKRAAVNVTLERSAEVLRRASISHR